MVAPGIEGVHRVRVREAVAESGVCVGEACGRPDRGAVAIHGVTRHGDVVRRRVPGEIDLAAGRDLGRETGRRRGWRPVGRGEDRRRRLRGVVACPVDRIDGVAVGGEPARGLVRVGLRRRRHRRDHGAVAVDGVPGNSHVVVRCGPLNIDLSRWARSRANAGWHRRRLGVRQRRGRCGRGR